MGMPGVPWQILEDQLTLSQPGPPGGQIMPTKYYGHPRIIRPSYGPETFIPNTYWYSGRKKIQE